MNTRILAIAVAAIMLSTQAHATLDGCAVVLRTPDGFLNVRAKPTTHSRILRRLKPGEIIPDDTAGALSGWTHVYLENRNRWGWVSNHYIVESADVDSCESKAAERKRREAEEQP